MSVFNRRQLIDMTDHNREELLDNLRVGDIFGATAPNGARPFCLVTGIDGDAIQARTLSTQIELVFDRATCRADFDLSSKGWGEGTITYTIESVAPLPVDIHNTLLYLDRKQRLNRDPERTKLTEAEHRALCFIAKFYPENPL